MAQAIINLSASSKKRPPQRPLSKRIEISVGAFLFISIALICVLSLLFLSHSNRVATKGYELKMLQSNRSELIRKNEVLSMQIADLQTLDAMENDSIIKTMVKAERPLYIRTNTAVAKNNSTTPDS